MIYGSEEVFEIRIDDPLTSGPHFTPDLGQGIGGLATFTITKAARIKDLLKDRLQAIDQRLLTHPVVDRGYAQWPCLAGGSLFGISNRRTACG